MADPEKVRPKRYPGRAFYWRFGICACICIAFGLVNTHIRLENNNQGELCEYVEDGSKGNYVSQGAPCNLRVGPVLGFFTFFAAVAAILLLGPFIARLFLIWLRNRVVWLINRRAAKR